MTERAGPARWRMSTQVEAPDWRVETDRIDNGQWVTQIVGPGVDARAYRYDSYTVEGVSRTHRNAVRTAGFLRRHFERRAGASTADAGTRLAG